MEEEKKQLVKQPKLYQAISMQKAKKLSEALNKFLEDNKLVIEIAGKKYVPVEGWQFTGMQMGLTEVVQSCEPVESENPKEIKYKATVEVINQNGTIISRGFAWCSNQENKKKSFEEYAVASMAQTRAIGKAYRNILAWVVKMGGFEGTPAEEIDPHKSENDLQKAKEKVFAEFHEREISDSGEMLNHIDKAINKASIRTVEDAQKVLDYLKGLE